jgi:hypothetical protein
LSARTAFGCALVVVARSKPPTIKIADETAADAESSGAPDWPRPPPPKMQQHWAKPIAPCHSQPMAIVPKARIILGKFGLIALLAEKTSIFEAIGRSAGGL